MNQYLKAHDNQGLLCFFDSFWECILEKQGLISKEPRKINGNHRNFASSKHSQNSEAFSKGCLSDICHFGGQCKTGRAPLLCWSKGDALWPLGRETFLSHGDHETHPVTGMYSRLEPGHRRTTKAPQLPGRHMFGLHKSSTTLFYHHYTKQPFLSLMTGSDCLLPLIIEHHVVSRHTPCIWMLQALLVLAFGCPEVHTSTGKRHSSTVMPCPADQIFLPYSPRIMPPL